MHEHTQNDILYTGTTTSTATLLNTTTTSLTSLANVLRTSYGPLGLDKLTISPLGDVTITNDGRTILDQLHVDDPFQKMLVDLSARVDSEVGDGTTGVVLLAAELVKAGNEMRKKGLHAGFVVSGYKLAYREICKLIKDMQYDMNLEYNDFENNKIDKETIKNNNADKLNLKIDTNIKNNINDTNNCKINNSNDDKNSNNVVNNNNASNNFVSDFNFNDKNALIKNIIRTCLSSKLANTEHLVNLMTNTSGKKINFLKTTGSSTDSFALKGFGLNCRRASALMPEKISNAKILCIDFDLKKVRLPMNVIVTCSDPREIEEIKKREESVIIERIEKIIHAGVNVLLSSKGIDDLCIRKLQEGNVMAVKRVKEEDLEEIARICGTTVLRTMSDLEGNDFISESNEGINLINNKISNELKNSQENVKNSINCTKENVKNSINCAKENVKNINDCTKENVKNINDCAKDKDKNINNCTKENDKVNSSNNIKDDTKTNNKTTDKNTKNTKNVYVEKLGDQEVIVIESDKFSTIILKGSSEQLLDEMERSMHDAQCVIKRLYENKYILPSGGAVECACYLFLKEYTTQINSKESLAIDKYADSLLSLPRLLSSNAGLGDELVAELLRKQSTENDKKSKDCFDYGLDCVTGTIGNNIKRGIVEPAIVKLKTIRAATEAAISVLRIDEMIVLGEEKKPERDLCH
ncbi:chaperonin-containing T-complex alpha subunit Cct1 [Conglomerata obtusa]